MSYGVLARKPKLYENWPYAIDFPRDVPPTRREEYHFAKDQVVRYEARTVLDAACGWKPSWHILPNLLAHEDGCTITAMDANPEVLYNFKPHRGIIRMMGDLCGMPFADNQFDAVLCISTIEHLPPNYRRRALAELVRVCRGTLILTADGVAPENYLGAAQFHKIDVGERIDQPGDPLQTEDGASVTYMVAQCS